MPAVAEPRSIVPEVAACLGRLTSYIALRPDWDANGALSPDPSALRSAMLFLLEQIPSGPAPSVGPGVDGTIEMEWERSGLPAVTITFGPGEHAFMAVFTAERVLSEFDTGSRMSLATELSRVLRSGGD